MQNQRDSLIIQRLQQKVMELNVLNSELMSLNPSAKVYRQKGSGNVLFLANKASLLKDTEGELADVQRKLKDMEERLQQ